MNTKAKVKHLLELIPELADSDTKLTAHIWFREMEKLGYDPTETQSYKFFQLYAKGKLTLAPSIKRARAKLQEEEPRYRGKKYHLRKGTYQDEWRKKLGYEINK
ncbi:MAG: hypothetical protein Unbinned6316contig1000_21 [Prokaryotic dsDNA virus sp.]|nr:MAG: hypothetical protein Unbinned6316contig1000_21 [Prokaryotic dsDNA virus sp.]|tara:strand:- start:14566 stop:14877 length:312 start_codon:yes stop_codon:yes gene_type:complete